ncbi:MAG: hypothetical protein KDJ37_06455 [Hyphomicrobiaceae bacterium]|nr:hypothetical protein [Hyphomicrobiaceae bacterium]
MHIDDPIFPPLLTGHAVKAPVAAFAEACRAAEAGELGAADIVYARNTAEAEIAIILEPDVARKTALQMLPLFALAVIEAVGALMPPKTSVLWRWPDRIVVNGGEVGRLSFAMSAGGPEDVPRWIVLGATLRVMPEPDGVEPGERHEVTSLFAEGSGDATRSRFLEMIAAFTLTWITTWSGDGFEPVHAALIGRIEGHAETAVIAFAGEPGGENMVAVGSVLGLDDEMRLLVKAGDGDVRALTLEPHVATLGAPALGAR